MYGYLKRQLAAENVVVDAAAVATSNNDVAGGGDDDASVTVTTTATTTTTSQHQQQPPPPSPSEVVVDETEAEGSGGGGGSGSGINDNNHDQQQQQEDYSDSSYSYGNDDSASSSFTEEEDYAIAAGDHDANENENGHVFVVPGRRPSKSFLRNKKRFKSKLLTSIAEHNTFTSNTNNNKKRRMLVLVNNAVYAKEEDIAKQQTSLMMLQGQNINPIIIDGGQATNYQRRNELFDISGLRRIYPQFFLVVDEEKGKDDDDDDDDEAPSTPTPPSPLPPPFSLGGYDIIQQLLKEGHLNNHDLGLQVEEEDTKGLLLGMEQEEDDDVDDPDDPSSIIVAEAEARPEQQPQHQPSTPTKGRGRGTVLLPPPPASNAAGKTIVSPSQGRPGGGEGGTTIMMSMGSSSTSTTPSIDPIRSFSIVSPGGSGNEPQVVQRKKKSLLALIGKSTPIQKEALGQLSSVGIRPDQIVDSTQFRQLAKANQLWGISRTRFQRNNTPQFFLVSSTSTVTDDTNRDVSGGKSSDFDDTTWKPTTTPLGRTKSESDEEISYLGDHTFINQLHTVRMLSREALGLPRDTSAKQLGQQKHSPGMTKRKSLQPPPRRLSSGTSPTTTTIAAPSKPTSVPSPPPQTLLSPPFADERSTLDVLSTTTTPSQKKAEEAEVLPSVSLSSSPQPPSLSSPFSSGSVIPPEQHSTRSVQLMETEESRIQLIDKEVNELIKKVVVTNPELSSTFMDGNILDAIQNACYDVAYLKHYRHSSDDDDDANSFSIYYPCVAQIILDQKVFSAAATAGATNDDIPKTVLTPLRSVAATTMAERMANSQHEHEFNYELMDETSQPIFPSLALLVDDPPARENTWKSSLLEFSGSAEEDSDLDDGSNNNDTKERFDDGQPMQLPSTPDTSSETKTVDVPLPDGNDEVENDQSFASKDKSSADAERKNSQDPLEPRLDVSADDASNRVDNPEPDTSDGEVSSPIASNKQEKSAGMKKTYSWSSMSSGEISELNDLVDQQERGLDVDERRLHELVLSERWNAGEDLDDDEKADLTEFQERRRKERKYRSELQVLLERRQKGESIDENRLHNLVLYARRHVGEELTDKERFDLENFEREEAEAEKQNSSYNKGTATDADSQIEAEANLEKASTFNISMDLARHSGDKEIESSKRPEVDNDFAHADDAATCQEATRSETTDKETTERTSNESSRFGTDKPTQELDADENDSEETPWQAYLRKKREIMEEYGGDGASNRKGLSPVSGSDETDEDGSRGATIEGAALYLAYSQSEDDDFNVPEKEMGNAMPSANTEQTKEHSTQKDKTPVAGKKSEGGEETPWQAYLRKKREILEEREPENSFKIPLSTHKVEDDTAAKSQAKTMANVGIEGQSDPLQRQEDGHEPVHTTRASATLEKEEKATAETPWQAYLRKKREILEVPELNKPVRAEKASRAANTGSSAELPPELDESTNLSTDEVGNCDGDEQDSNDPVDAEKTAEDADEESSVSSAESEDWVGQEIRASSSSHQTVNSDIISQGSSDGSSATTDDESSESDDTDGDSRGGLADEDNDADEGMKVKGCEEEEIVFQTSNIGSYDTYSDDGSNDGHIFDDQSEDEDQGIVFPSRSKTIGSVIDSIGRSPNTRAQSESTEMQLSEVLKKISDSEDNASLSPSEADEATDEINEAVATLRIQEEVNAINGFVEFYDTPTQPPIGESFKPLETTCTNDIHPHPIARKSRVPADNALPPGSAHFIEKASVVDKSGAAEAKPGDVENDLAKEGDARKSEKTARDTDAAIVTMLFSKDKAALKQDTFEMAKPRSQSSFDNFNDDSSESRILRIETELNSMIETASKNLKGKSLKPKAIDALTRAAPAVAYRKRFHDEKSNSYIEFPSVAATIVDGTLFDEARKYFVRKFTSEQTSVLLAAAEAAEAQADRNVMDYKAMESAAEEIPDTDFRNMNMADVENLVGSDDEKPNVPTADQRAAEVKAEEEERLKAEKNAHIDKEREDARRKADEGEARLMAEEAISRLKSEEKRIRIQGSSSTENRTRSEMKSPTVDVIEELKAPYTSKNDGKVEVEALFEGYTIPSDETTPNENKNAAWQDYLKKKRDDWNGDTEQNEPGVAGSTSSISEGETKASHVKERVTGKKVIQLSGLDNEKACSNANVERSEDDNPGKLKEVCDSVEFPQSTDTILAKTETPWQKYLKRKQQDWSGEQKNRVESIEPNEDSSSQNLDKTDVSSEPIHSKPHRGIDGPAANDSSKGLARETEGTMNVPQSFSSNLEGEARQDTPWQIYLKKKRKDWSREQETQTPNDAETTPAIADFENNMKSSVPDADEDGLSNGSNQVTTDCLQLKDVNGMETLDAQNPAEHKNIEQSAPSKASDVKAPTESPWKNYLEKKQQDWFGKKEPALEVNAPIDREGSVGRDSKDDADGNSGAPDTVKQELAQNMIPMQNSERNAMTSGSSVTDSSAVVALAEGELFIENETVDKSIAAIARHNGVSGPNNDGELGVDDSPHTQDTKIVAGETTKTKKSSALVDHVSPALVHGIDRKEKATEGTADRVVALISTQSGHRQQQANQDRAMTLLQSHGYEIAEIVDGSDQTSNERRDHLFAISKIRGNYPQFFVLNGGQTTYFGDYAAVEEMNDTGTLGLIVRKADGNRSDTVNVEVGSHTKVNVDTTNTGIADSRSLRILKIRAELEEILQKASMGMKRPLKPKAVQALRSASNVAYRRRFYDAETDSYIEFPNVARAVMDGTLLEEAKKNRKFKSEQIAMLKSAAEEIEAAQPSDMDYEMMNLTAEDIPGIVEGGSLAEAIDDGSVSKDKPEEQLLERSTQDDNSIKSAGRATAKTQLTLNSPAPDFSKDSCNSEGLEPQTALPHKTSNDAVAINDEAIVQDVTARTQSTDDKSDEHSDLETHKPSKNAAETRSLMIRSELEEIIEQASFETEFKPLKSKAVDALQKAAFKLAYCQRFSDTGSYPSVARTMVDGTLFEEARKHSKKLKASQHLALVSVATIILDGQTKDTDGGRQNECAVPGIAVEKADTEKSLPQRAEDVDSVKMKATDKASSYPSPELTSESIKETTEQRNLSMSSPAVTKWPQRDDDLPDDVEAACREMIPIVYADQEVDVERMLRRTPPDELYKYLKQQLDYEAAAGLDPAHQPYRNLDEERLSKTWEKEFSARRSINQNRNEGSFSYLSPTPGSKHILSVSDTSQASAEDRPGPISHDAQSPPDASASEKDSVANFYEQQSRKRRAESVLDGSPRKDGDSTGRDGGALFESQNTPKGPKNSIDRGVMDADEALEKEEVSDDVEDAGWCAYWKSSNHSRSDESHFIADSVGESTSKDVAYLTPSPSELQQERTSASLKAGVSKEQESPSRGQLESSQVQTESSVLASSKVEHQDTESPSPQVENAENESENEKYIAQSPRQKQFSDMLRDTVTEFQSGGDDFNNSSSDDVNPSSFDEDDNDHNAKGRPLEGNADPGSSHVRFDNEVIEYEIPVPRESRRPHIELMEAERMEDLEIENQRLHHELEDVRYELSKYLPQHEENSERSYDDRYYPERNVEEKEGPYRSHDDRYEQDRDGSFPKPITSNRNDGVRKTPEQELGESLHKTLTLAEHLGLVNQNNEREQLEARLVPEPPNTDRPKNAGADPPAYNQSFEDREVLYNDEDDDHHHHRPRRKKNRTKHRKRRHRGGGNNKKDNWMVDWIPEPMADFVCLDVLRMDRGGRKHH